MRVGMNNKLLNIGSFLIAVGVVTFILRFITDIRIFDPLIPPILVLVVGCAVLVAGVLKRS